MSTASTQPAHLLEGITVTVLEAATVVEGIDTFYRYDLPGTGIVEGWAVQATVEQIEQAAGEAWPHVEVELLGMEQAVAALAVALKGTGAVVPGIVAPPKHELNEPPPAPTRASTPPRNAKGAVASGWRAGLKPVHGVIACVLIGAAVISSVALRGMSAPAAESVSTAAVPTSTSAAPITAAPARSQAVVYERAALRVELPGGYELSEPEHLPGTVMATGPDPNLRVLLHADLTAGAGVDEVLAEVKLLIEQDETLELRTPGHPLVYLERPGDGSEVEWHIRVDATHMYSVGCHSKQAPTLPQKAACRMAANSLQAR